MINPQSHGRSAYRGQKGDVYSNNAPFDIS